MLHRVDPPVHHCTVFSAQQAQQLWQEEGVAGGGEPWLIRNYGGTAAAKMFGGARAGSAASDLEQLSEGAFVWAGIKVRVQHASAQHACHHGWGRAALQAVLCQVTMVPACAQIHVACARCAGQTCDAGGC